MAREKKFNTKYSPEFKLSVILDMRENGLGYSDTVRKYWGATTHPNALTIVRNYACGNAYT